MFRGLLQALRTALAPVWHVLAVPARLLVHVLMLPVDVVFLVFDVFWVNLRKTGWLSTDCQGRDSFQGGVCPPARKYTNRFLFRLVCPEIERTPDTGASGCLAHDGVRLHLVRGSLLVAVLAVVAAGGAWGAVRLGLGPVRRLSAEARRDRLVATSLSQGDAAFAERDYVKAAPLLRTALRLGGGTSELHHKLGVCLEAAGEDERALRHFVTAAAGDDAWPESVRWMALYACEKADVGSAREYAARAIALGVDDPALVAVQADSLVWAGDLAAAEEQLEPLWTAAGQEEEVRLAMAHLLAVKGETTAADELLTGLIRDSRYAALASAYRLDVLWKSGRQEEALQHLETSVQRFPDLTWLTMMLIEARFRAGQAKQALDDAEALAGRLAGSPSVKLDLARLLGRLGQQGRALQLALDCTGDRSLAVPANVLAAAIYLQKGLPEFARTHANAALTADPDSTPALVLAGRIAMAHGEGDHAVNCFRRALKREPENSDIHFLLGTAHRALANPNAAEQSLRRACELRPESGVYCQAHALALLAIGNAEEAREQLLKAAALLPRPYEPYTHLGVLAQSAGDAEEARDYYAKAIAAAPERALIAANNMAELLLSADMDIPLALAFAYSAHLRALGTPLEAPAADTLTKALMKAGYPAGAVGLARVAATVLPENSGRQYRLGLAEAAAGNVDEAAAALDRAADLARDADLADMARGLAETLRARAEGDEPGLAPQEDVALP